VQLRNHETNLNPSDGISLAILAAAIKLGINLENWAFGHSDSSSWLKEIPMLKVNSNLTLDKWNTDKRISLMHVAKKHLENLPDFFARLRAIQESDLKGAGAIHTPTWLSRIITKNTYDQWRRLHRTGKMPQSIADVSCGVGSFLFQARKVFGNSCRLIGIDNDAEALTYCELLNKASRDDWTLIEADSLMDTPTQPGFLTFERSHISDVDILLGNPPYVRSQLLSQQRRSELRRLYPDVTQGNFDLVILFVEHAIRTLNEGGIASYILSSKFMSSKYGESICKRLASDVRIIDIQDFGDFQLFDGLTTYVCILTFAKLPPAKRFTITTYPSGIDANQGFNQGQSYTLPSERLKQHPWRFLNGEGHKALTKLRQAHHPLVKDVFSGIVQGVRTGANQVFLVDSDKVSLEPELLLPFVSGEDLRRLDLRIGKTRLLFPYHRELNKIILIPQDELITHYPKTWDYLLSKQSLLSERSVEKKTEWYGYSRSQNLSCPWVRKVLVREMMPRSEFVADLEGKIAFSSGYALTAEAMSDEDLLLWSAVLNTPTMEYSLRNAGTQLHSGWFRLLKHHLTRVRLPFLDSNHKSQALSLVRDLLGQPENDGLWLKLDSLVSEAFNLTSREKQYIARFLAGCHERSMPAKETQPATVNVLERSPINFQPVLLEKYNDLHIDRPELRQSVTFAENKQLPIHSWYPFTQGFSESLVLNLIQDLEADSNSVVLDPFTGCGTTNIVCQSNGIPSIGIELSPLLVWLSNIKTRKWAAGELEDAIVRIKHTRIPFGNTDGLFCQNYLSKAYSQSILRQMCGIVEVTNSRRFTPGQKDFLKAGLIGITEQVSLIRKHGSHYRFMNASENIGLQKLNTQLISPDANIKPIYLNKLEQIFSDILSHPVLTSTLCSIVKGDARNIPLGDKSVDIVITSPPYLNRNVYIAQQKVELALLGFVTSSTEYRDLVHQSIRSHVEARFDNNPYSRYDDVVKIIETLLLSENNNKKIPHMIAGYFEDLGAVIKELARVVRPGGRCAFVVGNSRWGGVVVPVDHLLLRIAENHGFKASHVIITRFKGNSPQQMRRYGRIPLRESIIVFKKD